MSSQTKLCGLLIFVLTLALAGCQKANNQAGSEQPAEQGQAEQGGTAAAKPGTLKHRAKEERGKERPKPAEAPKMETITVPAGSTLDVRLNDTIDTGKTSDGAEFQATLASPLAVNGVEVAPVDSTVTGKVTHVVSSGRLNRPAELSLTLTSLTVGGDQQVDISTSTWSQKATSHKKRNAEMIGGGAGVGALIGALAGKGKGAAIGAAVGAGAGTAGAAVTGKKEIVLGPETKLSFTLTAPLTLTRRL